ncbi:hypothetical protein OG698_44915 [Streptomyces sp. NBC_01003]|uniref:hypothetical protein n=1 Tax=Streptomyces sp. NBC_01003 TaxID=2903714 RepID=UPI00386C5FA4|nr:hypothetical protein OG698_44915 [Streptomyces sp. NBC_01003]
MRSVLPGDDALEMAGTLLFHRYEHPETPAPTHVSDCEQLMRQAEHTRPRARGSRAGPAPTPHPRKGANGLTAPLHDAAI